MPTLIALLRAVNVGGTGKLPMAELRTLAERAGCREVRTYIQSGNLVCVHPGAAALKRELEAALAKKLGKPVLVLVRTVPELRDLLERNPFPDAPPNRVLVHLLDRKPGAADAKKVEAWPIPGREEVVLDGREVFLHYPDGQGRSKLKIPFAEAGTARNLNTLRAVLALAEQQGD
jgi:uncharacterized protein (DUF1697 family)